MFRKFIQILLLAGLILAAAISAAFASDKVDPAALGHYMMGVFYDDLGQLDRIDDYSLQYRQQLLPEWSP